MLVDTHCHLGDSAFDPDRAPLLERMRLAGVARAVVIESELERLDATLEWVALVSGLRMATGCHPHDARLWDDSVQQQLVRAWQSPLVTGLGEIGLDYHYDLSPRPVQRQVFARQLELAQQLGMPAIIHAREADADVVAILKGVTVPVILHSFSSGPILADAGLEQGWYFSFSGMVTFKSWTLDQVLRKVPEDRVLIETDAPYLAPVPWRGKRNEPSLITATAARVAEVRGLSPEELADLTTRNAIRLFWPNESEELSMTGQI